MRSARGVFVVAGEHAVPVNIKIGEPQKAERPLHWEEECAAG